MLAVSVITFIASLIIIPWLIIQMPEDYFVSEHRHSSKIRRLHPALYLLIRIGKNLLGLFLFFAGLIMFVLPGQGILTMFIGISLTDFPGKFRAERWFIEKPAVFKAINWIRRKANKPMLITPHVP
ncbi:MAG: hypothetical protein DSZ28_02530 [Thiothrix sp.]|nr:MAG: hypothetical protein DSZ28_02530 [Thiothrix sp.]